MTSRRHPYHPGAHRRRLPPAVTGALIGLLLAPIAWTHAQALTDNTPGRGPARDRPSRPPATSPARPDATGRGWSAVALTDIPTAYRTHYQQAAAATCPRLTPQLLAGIGWRESDHGRLDRPGVRSGLNRYQDPAGRWRSCCAGPMQFNLTDGPPSTWQQWRQPGDDVYDPADAIGAAARKLCHDGLGPGRFAATWNGTTGVDPCPGQAGPAHVDRALRRYNDSCGYAAEVVARAYAYTAGGRG